ncbi:MAG TPA: DUF1934 domain-containing protein [Sporosarcina psychrophila]|uniref:DUF1934 domain-containing protein n=1 Tax=Sporosarcina psychrophila TaxID=1476 RepID=A0A921G0Z8_SPOPS|nr:DUF1934 domain-containing protein [Sporosarcina psychrophila]
MESREKERYVKIKLHSSIRHPGLDEEKHEVNAKGLLIEKAGKSYLKYEEQQSGNSVQTIVKLDSANALIMRRGAVTMRLPFVKAGERPGTYGSGPATFDLVVKTEKLDFTENEDRSGGRFNVIYDLLAEESLLGTYNLTITYTEGTI